MPAPNVYSPSGSRRSRRLTPQRANILALAPGREQPLAPMPVGAEGTTDSPARARLASAQQQATLLAAQQQALLAGTLAAWQRQVVPGKRKIGPGGTKPGRQLLLNAGADKAGRAHIGDKRLWTWNGVTLAAPALRSLIKASRKLGDRIVGGGYRTHEQQAHLKATNKGVPTATHLPVRPPGRTRCSDG